MFRSSATLQRESRQRSIDPLVVEYTNSRHTWYDGSIESVGKRLAQCNKILSHVNPTLADSTDYLKVAQDLEEDRRRLIAERSQFTSGDLLLEKQAEFDFAQAVESFEGLPKNAKRWVALETPKLASAYKDTDRETVQTLVADHVKKSVTNLTSSQMRRLTSALQFSVGRELQQRPQKRVAKKTERTDYAKIEDQAIFLT